MSVALKAGDPIVARITDQLGTTNLILRLSRSPVAAARAERDRLIFSG
jgi:hypothetical protein